MAADSFQGHGERIKSRRVEMQLTQILVARHIGVTPPTIGQWEREETTPKGENVIKLAEILETTPQWLLTGQLATSSSASGIKVHSIPLVPFYSLNKKFSADNHSTPDSPTRLTTRNLGKGAFAIEVAGDAMLNPVGSPSMPDGSILIVDPTMELSDKSFVIAICKSAGPLFRQYVIDGPHRWLRALNPDYTKLELKRSDTILGTVVAIEIDLLPEV